jgi:hypothetical protein
MLDLIAGAAFDDRQRGLRPVSKADVFGEFMQPVDFDPEDFQASHCRRSMRYRRCKRICAPATC